MRGPCTWNASRGSHGERELEVVHAIEEVRERDPRLEPRERRVLLSYVDVVLASRELRRLEAKLAEMRRQRSDALLALLTKNGWLDRKKLARATYLYEQGQMISRGWLAAASLEPGRKSDVAIVLRYAKIGTALLEPYCTPKGARQMREILTGAYD